MGRTAFSRYNAVRRNSRYACSPKRSQEAGAKTLSICNVVGSTASREADAVFYTHSGPEIGVASTKAFTTQIVGLYLFAVGLGRLKEL